MGNKITTELILDAPTKSQDLTFRFIAPFNPDNNEHPVLSHELLAKKLLDLVRWPAGEIKVYKIDVEVAKG